MNATAGTVDPMIGRPRKYKDEEAKPVTVRLPQSVREHLAKQGPSINLAAYEAVLFEKDLTDRLDGVYQELLYSAAHQRQEYRAERADILARLIKVGLAAERATQGTAPELHQAKAPTPPEAHPKKKR